MSYRGEHSGGLSVTMKVASSDVGKVIGRGGKKIREFEQAGGGRIKINNAADESDMKSIQISGNDDEVEATRKMIEDFLRDYDISDSGGKRGGFSGDRNHSKPAYRSEGYSRENRHQDNGDSWRRRDEDDKDFNVGDRGGRRGGFSTGHNNSKHVNSSRTEGYNREHRSQDTVDKSGWCEDDNEADDSVRSSGGFGSNRGEDVYKSRNIYNSKRTDQDHSDRWGRHEEDEQAGNNSSSGGGRRGGFGGGRVFGSRGGGPSNKQHRDQENQQNGDRRGAQEDSQKGSQSSGGNRPAVDEDSETIYVMSSEAGKLIGRGGSRIRELETDSGCKIKVSRASESSDQSPVELTGSKSAISDAKRLIQEAGVEIINEDDPSHGNESSGGHRPAVDEDSETIYVISSEVGKIIGRGGSKIRELETDSGCKIKVSRASESSDQTSVELSGSKSAISDAKRLIQETGVEIINEDDPSHGNESSGGHRPAVDEDSETIYVISSEVGKIIGRGGSKIRELETDSGCKIKVSRACESSDQTSVELSGSKSAISDAKRLIQETGVEIINEDDPSHGNESSGGHRSTVDEDSETIYVISSEVGKIIGRGGSRIRELETDSGCKIKVSRASESSDQSPVELIGSKSAISDAKRLIQETGVEIINGDDPSHGDSPVQSKDEEEYVSELKKRPLIDWNHLRVMQKQYDKDRLLSLPEILKDFYKEEPHIKNMPHEEVKQIRKENNNIIVDAPEGDSEFVPNPIRTFEDCFKHYPLILEQIKQQNFVKPSPIQCQSWPVLLQGKDLIGIAQTGTGKTLAFLLPALIHIDSQPIPREKRVGPSALILSPTRELAQQIEMEINKINYKGIRSICVYGGGGNRREQLKKVEKGVEIVVATPGRLNDFMMNGKISVKHVTYLVMDEADRMLDLGFELEIKKVMLDIRPDRQTVMTSATWPPGVQKLAEQYMTKPYKVFVGTLDLAAVHSVTQYVEFVDEKEKKDVLLDFISNMTEEDKLIVFVGKKMVADDVSSDLAMSNIECQCIHGDREQCDRETALEEFKSGAVRILVATDVASRGLDVKDITHVLNYDFPSHIEEYVHRIGRTGRAGRSGISLTFMTRNDWKNAQQLIDIMSEANQNIPDELVAMAERFSAFKERNGDERNSSGFGGRGGGGRGGRGGGGGRGRRRNDDDIGMFWI